jgi:GT2 family glycosyltransferase
VTGTWCTELELSGPRPELLADPAGPGRSHARVLLRLHGVPIGFLEQPLPDGGLAVEVLLKSVDGELLAAINEHLRQDGEDPLESAIPMPKPQCSSRIEPRETISVAVCTRDRPEVLRGCLARLRQIPGPEMEFLIVDNAPSTTDSRAVFDQVVGTDRRFRHLHEPRPGLSRARNRALSEARGSVIAYTDDDVWVDPDWPRALAAGFQQTGVGCVTGLICTAAIDGPAERYFDARVSWADSCRPVLHRIGGSTDRGLFPYLPGTFGAGANFAVRTELLRELGGFDEALGAGTPAAGGEDLDIFVRVLLAGHALAYQPSAVVWHHHRAGLDELRRQMFGYGTGLSAFVTKHLWERGTRREVLRRIPRGIGRVAAIARGTHGSVGRVAGESGPPAARSEAPEARWGTPEVPVRELLLRELCGLLVGPIRYVRARRATT